MTAIASTGRRLTPQHGEGIVEHKFDLAVTATKHAKAGGMAALTSSGTVEPATLATGLVCLGRFDADYDNSLSLSPAPVARITAGVFSWEQTGTSITNEHIGTTVYMYDDQTVTLDDTNASPAGTCMGLDDDGKVKVSCSPLLPIVSHGFAVDSRELILTAASFVAGQGTGADTDTTPRTYNLGAALPAGALLKGYMGRLVTSCTGGSGTLVATLGSTGAVSEIASAIDFKGSPGYTIGTAGAAKETKPTAPQLLLTLTPGASTSVSDFTVGEFRVVVWFLDGTGI